MARTPIEIGPSGRVFAANLARFRGFRRLTLSGLSARMDAVGRPMSGVTINAIENQSRRADIDDLVALAAALGISPAAMLMPPQDDPYEPADATVNDHGSTVAGPFWAWLTAEAPLDVPVEHDPVDIERWRRDQVPPWAQKHWRELKDG